MHRGDGFLIALLIFFGILVMSCARGQAPGTVVPTARATQVSAPEKSGWQEKWEKLTAEGKKEGQVVIAASMGAPLREALSGAFTKKYGIDLSFISGKPAELVPKLQTERRAGLYLVDIFVAGTGTIVPLMGPEGSLEPLDKILLLPDVLDKKAWWNGDFPWADSDHFQLMFLAFPQEVLTTNTSLVKPDEIKSYRDLLAPKWKGKIAFLDPRMAGSGNSFFLMTGETLGLDYLRELGKQDIVFTRDGRILVEWVARGKYPIALGVKPEEITEFIRAGAPIKMNPVAEGTYLTGAGGGVLMLSKAPHSNAATVFINWILSKEGQTVTCEAWGAQSARLDVPTDYLQPEFIRRPGVKYYSLIGEGAFTKQREYMDMAASMWGDLLK